MKFSFFFSATATTLSLLKHTAALPSTLYGYTSNPARWGLASRADDADYEDQSWITKWAAIGDSYAAGIGAGSQLDKDCSRYDGSYPNLINNDDRLGNGKRSFQFLACSGATSPDIVSKQIPLLDNGQQVITISSGGNDVGLVTILNHCVYTWSAFNDDCEATLQQTSKQISSNLPRNLDTLLTAAKTKLDSSGTIYITGYAKFWDDSTTDCDKVSWHYWPSPIGRLTWQYLTQARRTSMNALVDAVNQQISAAVGRAGSNVVFVNYDKYYGDLAGRYCEPGVAEPDPNRADLLFYEGRTLEDAAMTKKRDVETLSNSTFEGQINYLIAEAMAENPEIVLPDDSKINTPAAVSFLATSPGDTRLGFALPSLVSDTSKRVFHPMQIGHALIANLVLYYMSITRASVLQTIAASESGDAFGTCPADPRGVACAGKSTLSVPSQFVLEGQTVDQAALLFMLRANVCSNQCVVPDGIDSGAVAIWQNNERTGCEISVAIEGGVEAWVYRASPSTGTQWQQCWDSTESAIDVCIIGEGSSSGWWNGPDYGQFYQIGFRPLNDGSALHEPFANGGTVVNSPSGNENLATISPSKYDGTIDCLDKTDGAGADTTNTFWLAGDVIVQGQTLSPTQQICTRDPSTSCLKSGTTVRNGIKISNWCLVYQEGTAGLVIADRYQDFGGGATGSSCIQGKQMIDIGRNGPLRCSGKSKVMVQMGLGSDGTGMVELGLSLQTVCVVNVAHPELCVAP